MTRRFSYALTWALGLATLLAACSDGPTGPDRSGLSVISSVEPTAGVATQTALAGSAVPVAPAVIVKDGSGAPMAGVAVQFIVTAGGGVVQNANTTTDAQGIASSGRWTLGSVAGTNELTAVAGNLAPVRFAAMATSPAISDYNITIRYVASVTSRQQQAVANAVARWQSAITRDLSNIPVNAPAGACFKTQQAFNEIVDDVLIFVEFVNIDGGGKVLGEAGPCYIRSDNSLPVVGHLKLDAADLQLMERGGTLEDVVLHEMGHVLGIGTLWPEKQLITGATTEDPRFVGAQAVSAYHGMGGSASSVPVENTGESGTRDGHWRESEFGNELMTGYVSSGSNPLSALTIASLHDLGYGANPSAASSYVLGGSSGQLKERIDLHGRERVKRPKYKVDRAGRKTDLPPL